MWNPFKFRKPKVEEKKYKSQLLYLEDLKPLSGIDLRNLSEDQKKSYMFDPLFHRSIRLLNTGANAVDLIHELCSTITKLQDEIHDFVLKEHLKK